MRVSELLKLKRNEILALAANAGAKNVRVFGSAALDSGIPGFPQAVAGKIDTKAFCTSLRVAPAAKSARTIRSSETLGSPASIFATRDWLDLMRSARSDCDSLCLVRACRTASVKLSLISTSAACSSLSCRKSRAEPARQPAARSRFNFSAFIALFLASHDRLIAFQSGHANVDYLFGCPGRRLGEHFENDYGVVVDVIHHAPCSVLIRDSQFVAAWTYRRHRPRMRKLDLFTALKPAQETAGFNAGCARKRRGAYLAL